MRAAPAKLNFHMQKCLEVNANFHYPNMFYERNFWDRIKCELEKLQSDVLKTKGFSSVLQIHCPSRTLEAPLDHENKLQELMILGQTNPNVALAQLFRRRTTASKSLPLPISCVIYNGMYSNNLQEGAHAFGFSIAFAVINDKNCATQFNLARLRSHDHRSRCF